MIECFNELVEEGKVDMYRSLEYTYSSRHMKSFATRRGTLACVKMWHEKEKTEVKLCDDNKYHDVQKSFFTKNPSFNLCTGLAAKLRNLVW